MCSVTLSSCCCFIMETVAWSLGWLLLAEGGYIVSVSALLAFWSCNRQLSTLGKDDDVQDLPELMDLLYNRKVGMRLMLLHKFLSPCICGASHGEAFLVQHWENTWMWQRALRCWHFKGETTLSMHRHKTLLPFYVFSHSMCLFSTKNLWGSRQG